MLKLVSLKKQDEINSFMKNLKKISIENVKC